VEAGALSITAGEHLGMSERELTDIGKTGSEQG